VSEILDDSEIEHLTRGVTQGAARARRLEKMLGCKVPRRPDGFPVVTRDMLSRLDTTKHQTPADAGINWPK